ncbi:retrovirus-related pol polyprotein from transposon TNT 1-94 [Tanacetum coccineum]
MKVKKSLNVTFDESSPPTKLSPLVDDDVGEEEAIKKNTKVVNYNNKEDGSIEVDETVNIKESKNHPLDQVIGNLNQRTLRSQTQNHSNFFCFISTIEPKDVKEALKDESWVVAMQEELNQFVAYDVWELVPLPMSQSVIGTKRVFRNKLDENGIVPRNKARLVAQGYNQQKGIEYDKTYAPVTRLESIRILLVIACANNFKLYKMDVKSAFLNGFINKEQAPKAWYDRLKAFLIKHEYSMEMVDNTLFTKKLKSHLIIVQIYVDDIIFGSTSQNLCDDFAKIMHDEFEMSMIWEMNFFLGLQIKQIKDGIFLNQSKYIKEMLKKFGLEDSKPTKMPMSTEIKLTKDDETSSVDSSKYRGMISSLLYLTFAKNQTALAISTTEAGYVSAGKACQQALWMKQALIDCGIRLDDVPITCNNKGAIDLSTKMPSEYQQDYKKTRAYALKIYNDPNMSDVLRDIYKTLESRYVHEGRAIDTSFYNDLSDDSVAKFTAIGFDCLLALDEQICPRFIFEF